MVNRGTRWRSESGELASFSTACGSAAERGCQSAPHRGIGARSATTSVRPFRVALLRFPYSIFMEGRWHNNITDRKITKRRIFVSQKSFILRLKGPSRRGRTLSSGVRHRRRTSAVGRFSGQAESRLAATKRTVSRDLTEGRCQMTCHSLIYRNRTD